MVPPLQLRVVLCKITLGNLGREVHNMFCVNVTLEFVRMNAMSVSVVPLIFFDSCVLVDCSPSCLSQCGSSMPWWLHGDWLVFPNTQIFLYIYISMQVHYDDYISLQFTHVYINTCIYIIYVVYTYYNIL